MCQFYAKIESRSFPTPIHACSPLSLLMENSCRVNLCNFHDGRSARHVSRRSQCCREQVSNSTRSEFCSTRPLQDVVDGWELNGELFPNEGDHILPIKDRVTEFCGKNRWYRSKKIFTSSQNAALIQYRVPLRGRGFVVSARYPKNPRPCNVLSVSTTDPFTLRNYGKRINCTLMAVYPGTVQVIALEVGSISPSHSVARMTETGTLRKCDTMSPQDQVQIGGSRDLDTTKLDVIDSICGIDSKSDIKESVPYDVTVVRLISSGYCDNSVTVAIRSIIDNDMLEAISGL